MFSLCVFFRLWKKKPLLHKHEKWNIQDHQLSFNMSHTYRLFYTGTRGENICELNFLWQFFMFNPKSLLVVYNLNIIQQGDYIYANLKTLLLHVQAAWISQITVLTLLSGSSPRITCHSCMHLWHLLSGWLLISFTVWSTRSVKVWWNNYEAKNST